jgi:small-conductance mechanosensitive channel
MSVEEILTWLKPVIIFVIFLGAGYIVRIVLDVYVKRITQKTKTQVDDIILRAIRIPILLAFLLGGLGMAIRYIPALPPDIAQYTSLTFQILIAVVICYSITKMISGLLFYYATRRPGWKTITPTVNIVIKFFMAFIVLMAILHILGVSIAAPLAALGVGGLVIGLALQSTLSDFLAGIYLMADRPVRVGDYIRLESGEEGYVVDVGWRSTKVRELSNNYIVVPNSKLASSQVKNFYLPAQEMSCLVDVGVHYGSDLEKVERVTIEVAKEILQKVQGGVVEFQPFIRYNKFDDFSINFTVILRVKEYVDKHLITHEFMKALHKRYNKEGIVIPFPIRTVYMAETGSKKQG